MKLAKHGNSVLAMAIWLLCSQLVIAAPLETAFTYQGELVQSGQPANGPYDFEFQLFDSATDGVTVANPVALDSVQVDDGIFTVALDFGSPPFAGDALWLEIAVTASGSGTPPTILSPRQPIRVTPYALHAEFVAMDAIGSAQIQDSGITASDLASGAVGSDELARGAVTSAAIAAGAVGSDELARGAVTSAAIAAGAVGSSQVADESLTATDLAPNSVGASELADAAVDESAIVDGAVTRDKLQAGAVGVAQVDTGEIQTRVAGLCPVGRMVRGINADGSLVCGVENKLQLVDNRLDDGGGNGAGFNSTIAIGIDGLPVIAFPTDINGTGFDVAIIKCNDLACSGGDEVTLVVADPGSSGQPFVAIGSDGLPIVAFGFTDLFLARCADIDCTSATIAPVDTGAESVGFYPTIAIGTDGFPVIAYRGASSVKVAKCNDLACSGGDETLSVIDPDGLAVDTTIAIGADGFPIVAYATFAEFDFRVAKCNDVACAGEDEQITILDDLPSGVTGRNNDIVIPPDGLPLIVYEDAVADSINIIKCNDPACAGGDDLPRVLDDPGTSIGLEAALSIGVDGFPIVAYWDFDADQLRIVHCNDALCEGGDESSRILVVTSDPPTGTGSGLDMAIGIDGLPIISFYDPSPPKTLGVVRCGRSDCAPFGTP